MKDEDLEKTISIETLDEISDPTLTREEKNKEEATTREARYDSPDMVAQALNEASEAGEEALAEKNINEAERLLEEEKQTIETPLNNDDTEAKEDEELKKKIKKILIIVGIVAAVIIVVLVIVLLVKGNGKDNKKSNSGVTTQEKENEEAPVIVDNYYYKEGKLYLLDRTDKVIGEYECINKDEKLCFVAYNENADDFDINTHFNEKNEVKKQRLSIYNDDYVFIFDNKNQSSKSIVLYSLKDKTTKETYLDVKAFDDNYVIVEDTSNKYGLIQIKDTINEIIKPSYDGLGMIDGEANLVAKKGNDYVIISKDNKELSAKISGANKIKKYNDKLIVTQNGKDYSVYSYKGDLIVGGYSFATIADKYIGLVNSKKLYIRDIDNNKYNEAAIDLKNSYYVHRNIYNDDNKLDYVLASFSINAKSNEIEVVVYEKEMKDGEYKHLELNTIAVNNNYKYMNYFNKVLYFYSDEAKEKLIGSYTCSNENVIDDSNLLKTCLPASDTIYEDNEITPKENRNSMVPIINNRFVFVADGTNSVILYDLVDKKTMGKYASVNTYTPNNDNVLSHYNGKKNVVALNKNGSYGMINIDGSNATSVYSFKYNKIEKMGDYFLAEDKDNKWMVLYSSTSTSSMYPGKIVNFTKDRKYFKILKDSKYYVYDANGKNISTDTFKEVTLYDSYFLGVNSSNELYLYSYEGTKITKDSLKPSSSCNLDTKYKISYKDNVYKIQICNGDKYDEYNYDRTTSSFVDGSNDKKTDETKTDDKTDDSKTENKDETNKDSSSEEKKES